MNKELCRKALDGAGLSMVNIEEVIYSEEDSPGLGYSSLLQRFKITSSKDSQNHEILRVIFKSNPDKNHQPDSLFDKMFSCEIKVYQNVLPLFKELFDKSGNSIVWPKLYAISGDQQIIMEDLKPEFRNNNEEKGSSLEEAYLAINSLAMFHASSLAAKAEGKINSQTLEPYFYCRSDKSINSFFEDGLRILVKSMRQSWDKNWLELNNKLEDLGNNIGEVLLKLHIETNDKFKVINHGDFWKANLMYKFNENNEPISCRFVDFQLSHYGSFAWDLSYFFFLNPNMSLKYDHYDELLTSYHQTMECFLDSCGSKAPRLSFTEIRQELERFFLYGFLKCCTDLPYHICSFESGIDAENLFKNNDETEKLKLNLYSGEKYKRIIKIHIDFLRKVNVL